MIDETKKWVRIGQATRGLYWFRCINRDGKVCFAPSYYEPRLVPPEMAIGVPPDKEPWELSRLYDQQPQPPTSDLEIANRMRWLDQMSGATMLLHANLQKEKT